MHFTIQREALLKPLQLVAGVVERRQTLPVLSNVLLVVEGQQLSLTGTDLEVELVGRVTLEEPAESGEITVPARKLMDICKSLPADALIDIRIDEQKLLVKAGRSRFSLSTLPANDFPTVEEGPGSLTFSLVQSRLRRLIERGIKGAALGPMWDPMAVRLCFMAGVGGQLRLRFGGKTAPTSGQPIEDDDGTLGAR